MVEVYVIYGLITALVVGVTHAGMSLGLAVFLIWILACMRVALFLRDFDK